MAVELATAYVSILPSAKGFKEKLAKELDIDTPAQRSGRSAGSRLGGALGSALKRTVAGVGVAAGAALSTALVKGWGRLTAIEDAQSKLTGLGHSAESVRSIMDNALASVKGTAFGLDEAATVAASTVAAGIKPGRDLERVLSLVADTASIAGSSMGEMGAIFNKVAASNRLTMAEVNQLSDRGIPILQMLADQMGVTAAEASKMVSSGKVDFAAFRQALEENVSGAALESGNTTRGAFANMMAAAGRFGAAILEGVFPLAKEGFGGITQAIDQATDVVRPWAEEFSTLVLTRVVPAVGDLMDRVRELAGNVREFMESAHFQQLKTTTLDRLQSIFGTLSQAAKDLAPAIGAIVTSLAAASGAIGVSTWQIMLAALDGLAQVAATVLGPALTELSGGMQDDQRGGAVLAGADVGWPSGRLGVSTWQLLLATLAVLAQAAATVLVPALTELSGWMQDNQGVVTVLVGAYVGWRTVLIAASAAAKVKAGWLTIMSVRTKAVAAATRVARAATVAWNASVVAGRWTAQISQLAVMRTRTLAVAAAQR